MDRLRPIKVMLAICLLTAIGIAACGNLAVQPETFNERVVYAYESLDVVIDTTHESLIAGAISTDEARSISESVKEIKLFVDMAEQSNTAGDLSKAEGQLALAENLLRAFRTRLNVQSWEESP